VKAESARNKKKRTKMHTLFTDQSSFTRHYGQTGYPPNTATTSHHYPYDQYTRYYAGSAYGLSAPHQNKEMVKPPYSYIALIGEFKKLKHLIFNLF
jgi:hypothetical protein